MRYVEISDLSHTYSTSQGSVEALTSVTGSFEQGETIAVLGPSGCGKSTLLRCLAGLLRPTVGTIRIDGRTPAEASREKLVGFAFQDPTLLKWRTVTQNILLPAEIGIKQPDGQLPSAYIEDLLRTTRMTEFRHSFPSELSGGMQRRVALARALLLKPKLLLLDEPLTGLDLVTRTELMVELSEILHRVGSTTIVVTHSVEEAVFLGSRIVVLSSRPGQVLDVVKSVEPQPRRVTYLETESFRESEAACRTLLFSGGGTIATK